MFNNLEMSAYENWTLKEGSTFTKRFPAKKKNAIEIPERQAQHV